MNRSFMNFLLESSASNTKDILAPLDETEDINITITDELLNNSKLLVYNIGQTVNDPRSNKEIPVNPKKFPKKAINIIFPINNVFVNIFFDTQSKTWDSSINYNGQIVKLSPDQMGQFFDSIFFAKLLKVLQDKWPLSDEYYNKLYSGIANKKMKIGHIVSDDSINVVEKDSEEEKENDTTPSGRKIVHFSDNLVSSKKSKFYCWPDLNKDFKWSQWKNWKTINPLCRVRIIHNGIPYGLSLSVIGGKDTNYKHRGFRGYSLQENLTPVQWLTKEENESIMKLSIINKFIDYCVDKIEKYISMEPEEIYKKINAPDNLTLDDVKLTRKNISRTLNEIIKHHQIDDFTWD